MMSSVFLYKANSLVCLIFSRYKMFRVELNIFLYKDVIKFMSVTGGATRSRLNKL